MTLAVKSEQQVYLERAAKDPNKKPEGRPTEIKRQYDISEVQDLYLDGYTLSEISKMTGHTHTTCKKYVHDLTAVIEMRNREKIEEKKARTIMNLRHYQQMAERHLENFKNTRPVQICSDIEMNIARLEGILVEQQNVNLTGVMALTDLIKAAKDDAH